MKIFHVGSHQLRESLRELLREFWFSHCTSRETPFREWDFAFREFFSEFRELLREYPGTLPELRELAFSLRERFLEIGVVPRFLKVSSHTLLLLWPPHHPSSLPLCTVFLGGGSLEVSWFSHRPSEHVWGRRWKPAIVNCSCCGAGRLSTWMARFARIDSQIRANRLSRANRRLRVPEVNPFLCDRVSRH